jgi:Spy/CpxP family protein refolding chaperone
MKVNRFSIAAAALGGLLAIVNVASAQNTNAASIRERRVPTVQQRVERMSNELKLTDDQKAKVTALFEKEAKQRKEIVGDTNLPREERRDKMRALMENETKQLKGILSAEQFEKLQSMREQARTRRPGHPGQPGGGPAPAPESKSPDTKAE